ncbi:hypothetical protein ACTV1J_000553 [Cronobacter turicensis]
MHSENNELVKAGHELAKCLDSNTPLLDIAKLLSKMATQLDATTAALREKTKQCEQVAQAVGWEDGGNFTLAEAVAGHVSGLKAAAHRSEELAAENAALKDLARGWANATDSRLFEEYGEIFHDSIDDCEAELKKMCPATDAFLREVKAQGAENAASYIKLSIQQIPEDLRVAYHDAIELCSGAADKLRKGGAA